MFLLRPIHCFIIYLQQLTYGRISYFTYLHYQLLLLHSFQHEVILSWGRVHLFHDFPIREGLVEIRRLMMKTNYFLNGITTIVFVKIIVELLHRLIFLDESLVIFKQLLVFLLVVDFLGELFKVNRLPTCNVSMGVDDCRCLVCSHCINIVHSTWNIHIAFNAKALLRLMGHFPLYCSDLILQRFQLLEQAFVLSEQSLLLLEQTIAFTHSLPLFQFQGLDFLNQIANLNGQP